MDWELLIKVMVVIIAGATFYRVFLHDRITHGEKVGHRDEKIRHLENTVKDISSNKYITLHDCKDLRDSCPLGFKMIGIEKSVDKLCKSIENTSEKNQEIFRGLFKRMGEIQGFMRMFSDTMEFLRKEEFVTFMRDYKRTNGQTRK